MCLPGHSNRQREGGCEGRVDAKGGGCRKTVPGAEKHVLGNVNFDTWPQNVSFVSVRGAG